MVNSNSLADINALESVIYVKERYHTMQWRWHYEWDGHLRCQRGSTYITRRQRGIEVPEHILIPTPISRGLLSDLKEKKIAIDGIDLEESGWLDAAEQ